MSPFDMTTTGSIEPKGNVLEVTATDDFAGGVMVSGGQLRVTLNRLVRDGTITEAQGHRVYDRWVSDLEAVMGEASLA